jgi:hypothetical protein
LQGLRLEAFDVIRSQDVPEIFNLVFKQDDARITCHVSWRQDDQIGVASD